MVESGLWNGSCVGKEVKLGGSPWLRKNEKVEDLWNGGPEKVEETITWESLNEKSWLKVIVREQMSEFSRLSCCW